MIIGYSASGWCTKYINVVNFEVPNSTPTTIKKKCIGILPGFEDNYLLNEELE